MVTYIHNVLRYIDLILVQIQLAGISSVMGKQAIVAAEHVQVCLVGDCNNIRHINLSSGVSFAR